MHVSAPACRTSRRSWTGPVRPGSPWRSAIRTNWVVDLDETVSQFQTALQVKIGTYRLGGVDLLLERRRPDAPGRALRDRAVGQRPERSPGPAAGWGAGTARLSRVLTRARVSRRPGPEARTATASVRRSERPNRSPAATTTRPTSSARRRTTPTRCTPWATAATRRTTRTSPRPRPRSPSRRPGRSTRTTSRASTTSTRTSPTTTSSSSSTELPRAVTERGRWTSSGRRRCRTASASLVDTSMVYMYNGVNSQFGDVPDVYNSMLSTQGRRASSARAGAARRSTATTPGR